LSKVIKASRITGECKIDSSQYIKKKQQLSREEMLDEDIPLVTENMDELTRLKREVIEQAKIEAAEIIEKAEDEALDIRAKAVKMIDESKQKGYEEGYQEGFAKGVHDGEEKSLLELNNLLLSFDNTIDQIKNQINTDIENIQQEVIKLAVKIAARILNTELEVNPELINNIVFGMLEEITEIDEISIFVNNDLLEYLSRESIDKKYAKQRINFIGDENLKPGDCVVETIFGGKDGTIERKLTLLEKNLLSEAGYHEED
jgi:flagellar assembly protein FliH